MAQAVGFEGANTVFRAPKGMEDCYDLEVCKTEREIISCWRLDAEELAEINRTGVVWLSVVSAVTPPVCVSGKSFILVDGRVPKAEPVIPRKTLGGKIKD